jgi:hypothetical protein
MSGMGRALRSIGLCPADQIPALSLLGSLRLQSKAPILFLTVADKKPRTLCACHPVACCRSVIEAPFLRRNNLRICSDFDASANEGGETAPSDFELVSWVRLRKRPCTIGAEAFSPSAGDFKIDRTLDIIASLGVTAPANPALPPPKARIKVQAASRARRKARHRHTSASFAREVQGFLG